MKRSRVALCQRGKRRHVFRGPRDLRAGIRWLLRLCRLARVSGPDHPRGVDDLRGQALPQRQPARARVVAARHSRQHRQGARKLARHPWLAPPASRRAGFTPPAIHKLCLRFAADLRAGRVRTGRFAARLPRRNVKPIGFPQARPLKTDAQIGPITRVASGMIRTPSASPNTPSIAAVASHVTKPSHAVGTICATA